MARKPPSEAKKKLMAAQRRPYTPAQLMAYVPCKCDPRTMPSPAVLDAAADRAFSGGYKIGPKNICPGCRLARSANGTCGCS